MDRVSHGWDDNPYADEDGAYVLFTEAQAEIARRDKRIAELEREARDQAERLTAYHDKIMVGLGRITELEGALCMVLLAVDNLDPPAGGVQGYAELIAASAVAYKKVPE